MTRDQVPAGWFCALLETATDVYFRYTLAPRRCFVYVSPSVHALTGHAPDEFYGDRDLCLGLIAAADRRLLRQVLRSRRGRVLSLHLVRHGVMIPIELRTIALTRNRKVVAIEGVATLARGTTGVRDEAGSLASGGLEPTQQRLATLMYEVHDLLHRALPPATTMPRPEASRVLRMNTLTLDLDRLVVTESGRVVALTSREVMVLRYLWERAGRVVSRQQLLADVWSYSYTGDDRTVDVHISRLRRKLPSLRGRLVAIKHLGYRFQARDDVDEEAPRKIANC
jgi:DNA-binding winged helix-turn-helix (wHTH) protein